jgi:hypothetical protein
MNTLMIKDLSVTEQLDRKAMSAVRGGYVPFPTSNYFNFMPISIDTSKHVTASQSNSTLVQIQASNGDGSAFQDNVHMNINPTVDNSNSITVK